MINNKYNTIKKISKVPKSTPENSLPRIMGKSKTRFKAEIGHLSLMRKNGHLKTRRTDLGTHYLKNKPLMNQTLLVKTSYL